jgi:ADP-ribosyl-[dinitrogen reductase] hydrolase
MDVSLSPNDNPLRSQMFMHRDRINRARGCLLGLAIGDAVGTAVEFKARGSFKPITDMTGGGPFGLLPGQWTDDTSMALCLGASLLEAGFDLNDQSFRYVRWFRDGYMSSTGHCFDIGIATQEALHRFERTGNPKAGSIDPHSAGNGCIMRLAPIPIRYAGNPEQAAQLATEQSTTTHGANECLEACDLFARILTRALNGHTSKTEVLVADDGSAPQPYSAKIQQIANGEYYGFDEKSIKGSGYVVESLQAALWCFYTTDDFQSAILRATNLGDDADTTAAITGQLAGAFYGEDNIPEHWREKIFMGREIGEMAEKLWRAQGG